MHLSLHLPSRGLGRRRKHCSSTLHALPSGISYITSRRQLKGLEVAQLLDASTTSQAPDLLHGTMALVSQQAMRGVREQHFETNPDASSQAIVLHPPASTPARSVVDGREDGDSKQGVEPDDDQHSCSKEAFLRQIERGIQHSSAVVAAYAEHVDLYGSQSQRTAFHGQHTWLDRIAAPAASTPRSLVGLARATSDESLVATIHEVCVHPRYRGRGIGRRLINLLLRQITSKGIYDIGALVPVEVKGFYELLGFEKDREQTMVMKLGLWSTCQTSGSPAPPLMPHGDQLHFSSQTIGQQPLKALLTSKVQQKLGPVEIKQ